MFLGQFNHLFNQHRCVSKPHLQIQVTCPLSSSITLKTLSTDTVYVTINYLFSFHKPSRILSDFTSGSLKVTMLKFLIHAFSQFKYRYIIWF